MVKERTFDLDKATFVTCKFESKNHDEKHCTMYRGNPDEIERMYRRSFKFHTKGFVFEGITKNVTKEDDLGKISKINLVDARRLQTIRFTVRDDDKHEITTIGVRHDNKLACAINDKIMTCKEIRPPEPEKKEPAFVDWDYDG